MCSLTPARIMFVQMAGQQSTKIRDETPTDVAISNYEIRHHITVTLYENSVNKMRIQLDCAQNSSDDLLDDSCSLT
ncbi:unnamed protein product, partial [Rotaria sp. Silwood2]